ncbi:hypothetical protein [Halosimplex salinum]|uniref:hypothetical protein n=1 Tax=Halosimplex salinum TaxID=1710538 RepID=UPI0013DDE79F|nr:hypothetical protein [Halosimplex salinum]
MSDIPEEVSSFVEANHEDDESIKEFRVLSNITDNFVGYALLFISLGSLLLGFLYIEILDLPVEIAGVQDLGYYVIIAIPLMISIGVQRVLSSQVNEFDYTIDDVAYHYLAAAIIEFYPEDSPENSVKYLGRFRRYMRNHPLNISPETQNSFTDYIQFLEDQESQELESVMQESFLDNTDIVISEIEYVNGHSIQIPEEDEDDESIPSEAQILFEAIALRKQIVGRTELAL